MLSSILGCAIWFCGLVVAGFMNTGHVAVNALTVLFCCLTNSYGLYNLLGRSGERGGKREK